MRLSLSIFFGITMMRYLWLLLLYLPSTVFAQTALDDWYGQWISHYSGGNSGTCSVTISSSTMTEAALSGSCISDANPQLQNLVSGRVTLNGGMTLTAGTTSAGTQFSGTLLGTSGSGQWVDSLGISGTWTMSKLPSHPTTYVLAVTHVGSGTVTSSTAGIDCGSTCSGSFSSGTTMTLTATPSSGSYFVGWSGDCTGTGSCVVTMNAAKNVTATFDRVPFAIAATGVTAGTVIEVPTVCPPTISCSAEPVATVTTRIAFNSEDVGKTGAVFVTAWVPVNGLSALGIATALSGVPAANAARAATDSTAFALVQLTSSGWQMVQNGQLIPYVSGVLGDALAAQAILNNTTTTPLIGAQFCVGYGSSAAEMIAAGRMMPVAAIRDPNSTAKPPGSCNVTDVVVEFYNTNLDHYFITADTNEAAQIDGGSAGPGWSRTGNSFRSGGSTSVAVSTAVSRRGRTRISIR